MKTKTKLRPKVEYALDYALLGMRVFPCHWIEDGRCSCDEEADCGSPGKHPLTPRGFKDATTDEATIREWWRRWPKANIAARTGDGWGVLDIDEGGEEALRKYQALSETVKVRTGSGFMHHYFHYDGHLPSRNGQLGKGLDVKADGGYVMMPGSQGIERPYKFFRGLNPMNVPLADFPPDLLEVARNGHKRLEVVDFTAEDDAEDDDGGDIPEGKRNATLTSLAGTMRRRGMTESEITAALGAVNERCQPPLREKDVRGIAHSVARYDPKHLHFIRDRGFEKLQFITAQKLVESTPKKIDWAVRPYLVYGTITELVGRVKWAGKTTLALAMVDAVLDGEPFLGEPTQRSAVVFASEQPRASLRVQIQRAGLDAREDLHLLSHVDALAVEWPQVAGQIGQRAEEVGARVVVIDTLSRFAKLRGEEEQASGHAAAAMEPLEALAAKGLAVLVVRHERKGGGDVGESGRGSSAFAGAVDIVLRLRRREGNQTNSRTRVIDAVSRFEETPEKLVIELSPSGEYIAHGDEEALAEGEAKLAITSALQDGGTMERKQLRDAIPKEVSDSTLNRALTALVEEKAVLREKGGGERKTAYRYSIAIPE